MAEKQTFAFQAPDPVQGRPSAQGGYNTGQIIGGEVIGGDRSGIGPDRRGAVIGSFLDGLLEPYAQRKSKEAFAKGMTDQMYAEAGDEIRAGNGLLTQVFGPSAYEEGAIFYEAQQRVAQVQNEWADEEDQLKLLGPQEVAKAWADKLEKAKVGDTFLDGVIQDSLMKASPQMLQTVAKARYGYQQERASKAQADVWRAQGEVLQKQAESLAATGEPGSAGYRAAVRSFTDLFVPIKGQNDESFKKNLQGTLRTLAQRGQGHAVTALLQSNALDVLDEGDRARVEQVYDRSAQIALAKAAASPEVITQINNLNRDLEFGKLNPEEALLAKRSINERLKQITGFDADYFDASNQAATVKSVWQDVVANLRREEDKAERIADREDQQEHERQMRLLDATQEAANADLAWASASPGMAVASGTVKEGAMKARVLKGYLENDFAGLDRSFRDAIVGDGVKDAIKNTVSSTVAQGYTPEFENLVRKFDGMSKTNAAMAKEYFGGYAPAMRQFQRLRATGTSPAVAFASAFGDDAQYAPGSGAVAEASKEIRAAIKERQPWIISQWVTGSYGLNSSAQRTLANMVAREVAADRAGGGDRSDTSLIAAAIDRVSTLGQFESAGPFGWRNPRGEQPIYKAIGVDKATADRVIVEQIDASLRNRGYAAGAGGDEYEIVRSQQGGKPVLIVVPQDDNGIPLTHKSAVITVDQLKNAVNARKDRNNKAKGILKPEDLAWARIDPQRRIKGESVTDRVIRINREIKLRMDAGIPMYPVD